MGLPKAVQQMEEELEAEDLAMQQAAAKNLADGQDNNQLGDASKTAQAQSSINPEPAKNEQIAEQGEVVKPSAEIQPNAPVEKASEQGEKKDADYLERRLKTTEGMLRATSEEKKAAEAELREMRKQLEEQNVLLKTLLERNNAQPENKPSQTVQFEDVFTDEEKDQFGPEMLAVMQKVIARATGKPLSEMEARLKEVQVRASEEAQQVHNERTWGAIEKILPGSQSMYQDPAVKEWLDNTVDRITGRSFHSLATEAFAEGRAESVSEIFNAYKAAKQPSSPQPKKTPANIEPSGNGSSDASVHLKDNRKPVYTQAEIDKRDDEAMRLTRLGKNAEADAIMKENDAAVKEGRVKR